MLLSYSFSFWFFIFEIRCFKMAHNGHLQVVVADFEERQCPVGHDGQERSRDNANQRTRNAICNLLGTGFYFLL